MYRWAPKILAIMINALLSTLLFAAYMPSVDPLCRLSRAEKLRVCASVLSSSYFLSFVQFLPKERELWAQCQLNTVSFRTIRGQEAANGRIYKEWMLFCRATHKINNTTLVYSVSQAYHRHHVFVYTRHLVDASHWAWYLENISSKISVVTDQSEVFTKEGSEHPLPNLIDTLRIFLEIHD